MHECKYKKMEGERQLLHEKHVKYFLRCLDVLPSSLASLDAIRWVYDFKIYLKS